jgi:hypothetical protein
MKCMRSSRRSTLEMKGLLLSFCKEERYVSKIDFGLQSEKSSFILEGILRDTKQD